MANRPLLDTLELELVQTIDSEHDNVLHQTSVPGLDGDFLDNEGRRATSFTLTGVVAGEESADGLKTLRDKFAKTDPVSFVCDIATATKVDKVLIEEIGVREIAGKPHRFEYSFTLREYQAPPPNQDIIVPPPPPPVLKTTLEVQVIVDDDPTFSNFASVTVRVHGTTTAGPPLDRTLTNRSGDTWSEDPFPPGHYTFDASEPGGKAGSTVRDVIEFVAPNHVEIHIRGGSVIGNTFVVHYSFDRSFVEPCLRDVLRQVAGRARSGPADEKVLIVGHTDKVGPPAYNQSLSERRARGVFAFLTFALDNDASIKEWNEIRKDKLVGSPTLNDNWGTTQIQFMLQDLGLYPDWVDGKDGPLTRDGIRRLQTANGLPPTGVMSDETWKKLVGAYMRQDNFGIPASKFLPNCPGQPLKWIGCGEEDPIRNVLTAWRPNRRTEILFVRTAELPCHDVHKPDTFNLPPPDGVGGGWCIGPDPGGERVCFLRRDAAGDPNRILVQEVHRPPVTVHLRLEFDDGSPAVGVPYVLIAPDGQFVDGEVESATDARRGRPIPRTTGSTGEKTYVKSPGGTGVWTIEVQGHFIARDKAEPRSSGKGNVVCKHFDADGDFIVVLNSRPANLEFVDAADDNVTLDRVVFGQPFRLRADIPNETRDEITVELMSYLIRRP